MDKDPDSVHFQPLDPEGNKPNNYKFMELNIFKINPESSIKNKETEKS